MKKIIRKWWFWLAVVLVIGGMANGSKQHIETPEPVKHTEPAKAEKTNMSEDQDNWKVTAAEYYSIENGMTYREVVEVTGMLGTRISEAGEPGADTYAAVYKFDGIGDIGANVVVEFQGGKVIGKGQFGLK